LGSERTSPSTSHSPESFLASPTNSLLQATPELDRRNISVIWSGRTTNLRPILPPLGYCCLVSSTDNVIVFQKHFAHTILPLFLHNPSFLAQVLSFPFTSEVSRTEVVANARDNSFQKHSPVLVDFVLPLFHPSYCRGPASSPEKIPEDSCRVLSLLFLNVSQFINMPPLRYVDGAVSKPPNCNERSAPKRVPDLPLISPPHPPENPARGFAESSKFALRLLLLFLLNFSPPFSEPKYGFGYRGEDYAPLLLPSFILARLSGPPYHPKIPWSFGCSLSSPAVFLSRSQN